MRTGTTAEEHSGAKRAGVRREASQRAVWIVLLALLVLVIGACSSSADPTTSSVPTSTSDSPDEPTTTSVPDEPECSAEALLAAAQDVGIAEGAYVADFGCTPAAMGDLYGGYAWAWVEAPEADPTDVFYTAYVGQGDEGPVFGEWEVLTYGTDVTCDDDIPAEACDLLTEAPRRTRLSPTSTEAPNEETPDEADPGAIDEPPCSAEALLAAADAGVGSPGADAAAIHDPDRSVTSFACTSASMGDLVGGYAWARVESGSLDPIVIFYTAYEGQTSDGGALYGEWETLNWGTDATCDEEIPAKACDLLTGAPRG
jgi:hypothetical protein